MQFADFPGFSHCSLIVCPHESSPNVALCEDILGLCYDTSEYKVMEYKAIVRQYP